MASLFTKRLCVYLDFSLSPLRPTLLTPIFRLSTGTHQSKEKDQPFLAQYLVSSFGISPDRAQRLATSAPLSAIKTLDQPVAVLHFFKEIGMSDSQVKGLVSWDPQLLCCSVTKTFQPRVEKLMAEGLSGKLLIDLVRFNPSILNLNTAISRVQFWMNFVGYRKDILLKIIRMNRMLLHADIDKYVIPRIKLLKEHGFSDAEVLKVVTSVGNFILKKTDSMKMLIDKTEALGFSRASNMFIHGLAVVATVKTEKIIQKLEFLRKNYGLSEKEAQVAFKKFPALVRLSEGKLKSQLDFLLGKAGLMSHDISSKPLFLGYSLEKRIIPRHHVLSLLKCKGLNNAALYSAVVLSERDFLDKFVVPYEKEIPELGEVYTAACQGKMPV